MRWCLCPRCRLLPMNVRCRNGKSDYKDALLLTPCKHLCSVLLDPKLSEKTLAPTGVVPEPSPVNSYRLSQSFNTFSQGRQPKTFSMKLREAQLILDVKWTLKNSLNQCTDLLHAFVKLDFVSCIGK